MGQGLGYDIRTYVRIYVIQYNIHTYIRTYSYSTVEKSSCGTVPYRILVSPRSQISLESTVRYQYNFRY